MRIDKKILTDCIGTAMEKVLDYDVDLMQLDNYLILSYSRNAKGHRNPKIAEQVSQIIRAASWDYQCKTEQVEIAYEHNAVKFKQAALTELREIIDVYKRKLVEKKYYTVKQLYSPIFLLVAAAIAQFEQEILRVRFVYDQENITVHHSVRSTRKKTLSHQNSYDVENSYSAHGDDRDLIAGLKALIASTGNNIELCHAVLSGVIHNRTIAPAGLFERCLKKQGLITRDGLPTQLLTDVLPLPFGQKQ